MQGGGLLILKLMYRLWAAGGWGVGRSGGEGSGEEIAGEEGEGEAAASQVVEPRDVPVETDGKVMEAVSLSQDAPLAEESACMPEEQTAAPENSTKERIGLPIEENADPQPPDIGAGHSETAEALQIQPADGGFDVSASAPGPEPADLETSSLSPSDALDGPSRQNIQQASLDDMFCTTVVHQVLATLDHAATSCGIEPVRRTLQLLLAVRDGLSLAELRDLLAVSVVDGSDAETSLSQVAFRADPVPPALVARITKAIAALIEETVPTTGTGMQALMRITESVVEDAARIIALGGSEDGVEQARKVSLCVAAYFSGTLFTQCVPGMPSQPIRWDLGGVPAWNWRRIREVPWALMNSGRGKDLYEMVAADWQMLTGLWATRGVEGTIHELRHVQPHGDKAYAAFLDFLRDRSGFVSQHGSLSPDLWLQELSFVAPTWPSFETATKLLSQATRAPGPHLAPHPGWPTVGEARHRPLPHHAASVVAVCPRGRMLATASGIDCTVRIWDLATASERWLMGPAGPRARASVVAAATTAMGTTALDGVSCVAFSLDGEFVAAAVAEPGGPPELRLWSLSSGALLKAYIGHDAGSRVTSLHFLSGGRLLSVAVGDPWAIFWEQETGAFLQVVSMKGWSSSCDRNVDIDPLTTSAPVENDASNESTTSPSGTLPVCASVATDGRVILASRRLMLLNEDLTASWTVDVSEFSADATTAGARAASRCGFMGHDESLLWTSAQGGSYSSHGEQLVVVTLRRAVDGARVGGARLFGDAATATVAPNGTTLIMAGADGIVRGWPLPLDDHASAAAETAPLPLWACQPHMGSAVQCVVFVAEEDSDARIQIASVSPVDGVGRVWSAPRASTKAASMLQGCLFGSGGRNLVVWGTSGDGKPAWRKMDSQVRSDAAPLFNLTSHQDRVAGVAVFESSPDASGARAGRVLTFDRQGTLQIWDEESGAPIDNEIQLPLAEGEELVHVTVSPNGEDAVVAMRSGSRISVDRLMLNTGTLSSWYEDEVSPQHGGGYPIHFVEKAGAAWCVSAGRVTISARAWPPPTSPVTAGGEPDVDGASPPPAPALTSTPVTFALPPNCGHCTHLAVDVSAGATLAAAFNARILLVNLAEGSTKLVVTKGFGPIAGIVLCGSIVATAHRSGIIFVYDTTATTGVAPAVFDAGFRICDLAGKVDNDGLALAVAGSDAMTMVHWIS
ncbi:hypothetical protein BDK51DRAFT_29603 [Blyttiomyces helicus]|uniref:WD40-repeat-containing domain protein n=1 Tax=Blyttiomyces helicus TaxID=388810 RepID=A0A4P9W8B2_9FUNG|nr:hypothetical protein BDK51DRAFT_29603 [Blyttiomyces helicus]|eukprot:RKO87675.1 hypothetical protein BDK51DRAFT_29603 [Blyttiomyces helicus]